jgi:hypothetical protein
MAIDYTDERFAFPKSQVRALVKQAKDAQVKTTDEKENAKARKRAKGQCEVCITLSSTGRKSVAVRCERKDVHTHHLLGGVGRRNKGKSILADYKLRVCAECHELITRNILQPTTAEHDAYTVKYWRQK